MMCYAHERIEALWPSMEISNRIPLIPITDELDMTIFRDRVDIILTTIIIARILVKRVPQSACHLAEGARICLDCEHVISDMHMTL
jgi:hypothetical protein